MELLEKVKLRLGITDDSKDELIGDIIDDVKSYIVTACNRSGTDDIPDTLSGAIVKMAVIDYNRLGVEGLSSENYSGASYSYEADYPDSIKKELYHERLVRMS